MGGSYMVVQKCAQYAMNILKPEPNRRLADDIVKCISLMRTTPV